MTEQEPKDTPEEASLVLKRLRDAQVAVVDNKEREAKLQAVEQQVREALAARRQADLDALFHVDEELSVKDPETAAQLKERFLEEKEGLSIKDTFLLSLKEPYFGAIYLTKLASTDHEEHGASQKMFQEMREFVAWMKEEGPLQGVDPYDAHYGASAVVGEDAINSPDYDHEDKEDFNDRWRSGRWMAYEYIGNHDDALNNDFDGDRVVITRIRPFANANSVINGVSCDVKVYKETVFTLPTAIFKAILSRFETSGGLVPEYSNGPDGPINEMAMRKIEEYMYQDIGEGCRQRIDTSIFSAVLPVERAVQ